MIGGPPSAANETVAIPMPMYLPILLGSFGTCANDAVINDTIAPEKNPYSAEKTMIDALVVIRCQQRMRIPVQRPAKKSKFSGPNLSASMPGITRPKSDMPFKIAIR